MPTHHPNFRPVAASLAVRAGTRELIARGNAPIVMRADARESSLVRPIPTAMGKPRPGSRQASVESGPTPGTLSVQDVQLPPVLTDFPVVIATGDYPDLGTAAQLMNVMNVVRARSIGDPAVYAGVAGVADLTTAPLVECFGVVIMGGKPPLTTSPSAPLTFETVDFTNGATAVNRKVTLLSPNSPAAAAGRLIEPMFAPGSLGGLIFLPFAYRGLNLRANPIISNTRGVGPAVRVTGGSYEFSVQILSADTPLTATLAGLLSQRIGG